MFVHKLASRAIQASVRLRSDGGVSAVAERAGGADMRDPLFSGCEDVHIRKSNMQFEPIEKGCAAAAREKAAFARTTTSTTSIRSRVKRTRIYSKFPPPLCGSFFFRDI